MGLLGLLYAAGGSNVDKNVGRQETGSVILTNAQEKWEHHPQRLV